MENEKNTFEEQSADEAVACPETAEEICAEAAPECETVCDAAEVAETETEATDTEATDTAAEENEETPAEEPAKPCKFKRLIKKWWFWVIVGVVFVGLTVGIIAGITAAVNNSDSDSSYGGSTYVSPYVTMVKTATNSSYGITYGAAFESFFSNTEWSYFKATSGEDVVEFEGDFLYDGSTARAKIQFIVDVSGGTMSVYHLSINGVDQSKLMLATLVNKVFTSY